MLSQKRFVLAHSRQACMIGVMKLLTSIVGIGSIGKGGGLLPGRCASSSKKGHLSRFDVFVDFRPLRNFRFQSRGWLPNG